MTSEMQKSDCRRNDGDTKLKRKAAPKAHYRSSLTALASFVGRVKSLAKSIIRQDSRNNFLDALDDAVGRGKARKFAVFCRLVYTEPEPEKYKKLNCGKEHQWR